MLVATRLVEMDLPEDKVLENLNRVSTAKRQAYMVSKRLTSSMESNICFTGAIRHKVWAKGKDQ